LDAEKKVQSNDVKRNRFRNINENIENASSTLG
jgi:hypothetical protein